MEGYVFAFGLGWQALALAAAALITHRPQTWKTDLVKAIQAVDWRKGPHCVLEALKRSQAALATAA
jgi:DNA sulfur modification protein DndB